MNQSIDTNIIATPLPIEPKKRRIWELDFLRGICVLLMVWDHFMYDVVYLFGKTWIATGKVGVINFVEFATDYLNGSLRDFFHPVIFTMFFVICGISCSFSRSNLKRGIEALFFAFIITIITTMLETPITFGVLHMLGFAILTWWLIDTLCRHNKRVTAIACLVVGIIITTLGHVESVWANAPMSEDLFFISEYFGGAYNSSDYFPIFPYVGYMLIGAAAGVFIYPKGKSLVPIFDKFHWHEPVSFWGRIALWVYVFHQVAVMVILCFISYLFITPGDFVFI